VIFLDFTVTLFILTIMFLLRFLLSVMNIRVLCYVYTYTAYRNIETAYVTLYAVSILVSNIVIY